MPPTTTRSGEWIAALALGVLAFALFAQTLGFGLVWDDPIILFEQLPAFHGVHDVLFPPANAPGPLDRYYRPVVIASLLADDALGRALGEPQSAAYARAFHASTTLFHALASAAVLLFGAALARAAGLSRAAGLRAGALGGLLFAVHPIHVETVAWIVGRSDSLCALFGVTSLVLYLRHHERGGLASLGLSALAMLASMLSKEAGVVLPALVPLLDAVRRDTPSRAASRAVRWGAFAAAVLLYGVLRAVALGGAQREGGMASGWTTVPAALGWYLVKAVWPPPQLAAVTSLAGGFAWAGAIGAVALAALAWWLVRRGDRAAIALLALFVITLLPALAVPVLGTTYIPVAERFLYLPTVGLCLLAGLGLERLVERRGAALPLSAAAVVVLLAAWSSVAGARVWRDQLTLWSDVIAKAPSAAAYHNRGKAYFDAGQNGPAIEDLTHAIALDPRVPFSYELRGTARLEARDARGALDDFEAALAIEPRFLDALEHRAAAAEALGDRDRALDSLSRLLALDPARHEARARRALLLVQAGRLGEALADFDVALAADPARSDLFVNRGVVRARLGRLDQALADFEAATRADPRNAEAWYNLGLAQAERRDDGAAVAAYSRALEIDPAHADARFARAAAALRTGDVTAARNDVRVLEAAGRTVDPRFAAALRDREARGR